MWLTVAGYTLIASGLPLRVEIPPAGGGTTPRGRLLAAKDSSRPFPCRDKPCGCMSAEQCFRKCCCHTPSQLLAWARRHDVEPAVLAALQRRAGVDRQDRAVIAGGSCCASTVVATSASCCSAEKRSAPIRSAGPMDDAPPDQPAAEPVSRGTVVLRAMLACGGILAEWFSIGGAPPPPAVVAVACISPLAVTLVDPHECLRSRHVAPDVPPPRVA